MLFLPLKLRVIRLIRSCFETSEDPESPRVAPLRYSRCCNRLTQWWRQPASPRTNLVSKSFIRFLKLFLIGFILQGGGFPNHYRLDTIRIPGILQRIGFCYFVVRIYQSEHPCKEH